MPPAELTRSFRHAVALGLIQGPSELLPISSSAHTRLIPLLAGWTAEEAGQDEGRSFEVALHGAASLALALEMAGPLARELPPASGRLLLTGVLAMAPPAIAGLALRRSIETRLSGSRSTAAGLVAGAAAMAIADRRHEGPGRTAADAGPLDGLLLGLAQAVALAPGVSRNGATLTVARARGFGRPAAQRLSWGAGLPVMGGASAAEAVRLAHDGPLRGRSSLLGGALAAFCSTRLSARLLAGRLERGALWPYALYRCLLAGLILLRVRRAQ
jgi:undecaprenyl-diphosphatase